mgnify:CR=1 FL=1
MSYKRNVVRILLAVMLVAVIMVPAIQAYASVEIVPMDKEPSVKGKPVAPVKPIRGSVKAKPVISMKVDQKILDREYIKGYSEKYASILGAPEPTVGLIVKVSDLGKDIDKLKSVVSKYGGKVVKVFKSINAAHVVVPSANDAPAKLSLELSRHDWVSSISLDRLLNISMFDTRVLLGFPRVWEELGYNGTGVRVAVIDTGIDVTHPELNGTLDYWIDFINGEPEPYDDNGHGTFVSGVIAARGVWPWLNGEGLWHSVNYNDEDEFNNPGPAWIMYWVNVTDYDSVTLNYTQRYWIEEGWDYGYVMYSYDGSTWNLLASYTGTNFDTHTESYTIDTIGYSDLYIAFVYDPDSSVQWGGWWLDDITVYNSSDPSDVLLYDDVEGPPPAGLVYWDQWGWTRTSTRLQGVAPGARLMVAKVCTAGGSCPIDAIISAIEWAVLGPDGNVSTGDEADIISMSLGGTPYPGDPTIDAVNWAYSMGVTCVVAAGNSGPGYKTVESPSVAYGAISVGATTKLKTMASFSSWGPSPLDFAMKPDISAPGRYIISTYTTDNTGEYWIAIGSGTSFSTPHVSGVAALIKQAHPEWGPEEVRSALVSTTEVLESINTSTYTYNTMNPYIDGAGMVKPYRAVKTTFLPIPAIVSFGRVMPPATLAVDIALRNYGSENITVNVTDIQLFDVDENDFTSWIVSPSIGDTFNVSAGGSTVMHLEINVSSTAPGNYYWGRVGLQVVDGWRYQVVFGFTVPPSATINGIVVDVLTREPLEGINVTAIDASTGTVYDWCLTDSNGYYELTVPADTYIRIVATVPGLVGGESVQAAAVARPYYTYISPVFTASADTPTTWDFAMTPRFGYNKLHVLVVKDTAYGDYEGDSYQPSVETLLALNGTYGMIMRLWNNTEQGLAFTAILSGDFPVIAWMSGGVWYPVNDPLDMDALVTFVNESIGKGVLLEGGDIGWWHVSDELMTYVARAVFDQDISSGYYTLEKSKAHIITQPLPDSFDIDSSGYGWPDSVIPVNGGVDIYNWTYYNTGIVAYDGRPGARTAFIAFPVQSILNATLMDELVLRTLVWLFDEGAPVYSGTEVEVATEVSTPITVTAMWSPFTDEPFNIVTVELYLNGTFIADVSGLTEYDITPYVIPGNTYELTLLAKDLLGIETPITALFTVIPPGIRGSAFSWLYPGQYVEDVNIGLGGVIEVNTSSENTGAQLLELTPGYLPMFLSDIESVPGVWAVSLGFDLKTFNPSGIDNMTVTICYIPSGWGSKEIVMPVWLGDDGVWRPFSNYTADTINNCVTIYLDHTTEPTLDELVGRNGAIINQLAPVGGQVNLSMPSSASLALLISAAALVLLALIVALALSRKH